MNILKNYKDIDIAIQKKVPYLFVTNILTFILSTFLTISSIFSQSYAKGLGTLVASIIFALSANWVYKGKYNRGTSGIYAALIMATLSTFSVGYSDSSIFGITTIFYVLIHLLFYFFILNEKQCLFSNILTSIIFTGTTIYLFIQGKNATIPFTDYSVLIRLIIYYLGIFILFSLYNKLVNNILTTVQLEIKETQEREKKTMALVQASSEQLEKTNFLLSNADTTSSASIEIQANILSIKKQIENLNLQLAGSKTTLSKLDTKLTALDSVSHNQSASITESSSSIEEMTASINNVATIVQNENSTIDTLKSTSQKGSDIIQETTESFDLLKNKMEKITELTVFISNLAEQTNILSMNAAIEAAHAGDAGKGFGVVTDEVRSLAKSSTESSNEISKTLKELLDSIYKTGTNLDKTGGAFSEITTEIDGVIHSMQEITSSVQELNVGSKEILHSTTNLSELTGEVRTEIKDVVSGQSQVSSSLNNVLDISNQIVNGIEEISIGNNEITESIQKIKDESIELNNHAQKLQKQTSIDA